MYSYERLLVMLLLKRVSLLNFDIKFFQTLYFFFFPREKRVLMF